MLDAQLKKPSNNPSASPNVLIRKKICKLRLCVDYRKINPRTVNDAYPIHKVTYIYAALHGTQTSLRLGHLNITLILCAHFGLFSFEVISQLLTNSHLTVQWLMEKHVGDMNLKELLAYLDNKDKIQHWQS